MRLMIRLTLTCLALLTFAAIGQQGSSNKHVDFAGIVVHGNGFEGVIFPAERRVLSYGTGADKMQYWTPSKAEVSEAESKLLAFLQQAKLGNHEKDRILKNIKSYKRQYVGIFTGGKKELFINFFCESFQEEWTKRFLIVEDGGACFFRVNFSMGTKTFHGLEVNGYA
jgi:hypothetical protein